MKLFISYRRKSWPFTQRLAEQLQKSLDAEIFIDYRNIDETDFEVSIMRHLRSSDAVLLIVSEYTFSQDRIHKDDDWVRREIREALHLAKPIVVAFVDGIQIPEIPDDIKDIKRKQGINFYPEYFEAAIEKLVAFILKATPLKPNSLSVPQLTTENVITNIAKTTLADVIDLLEKEDYDRAITLLEQMNTNGYNSRLISIEAIITDTEKHRIFELRRREAMRVYEDIASLSRSKITFQRAKDAWIAFQAEYPEFTDDPENLFKILGESSSEHSEYQAPNITTHPNLSEDAMPDFENMTPEQINGWLETLAKRQGVFEVSALLDNEIQSTFFDDDDDDELTYLKAVALVRRLEKASISLLQRRLQIGYNRASWIIDRMEQEGIIGPATGNSQPRTVFPAKK